MLARILDAVWCLFVGRPYNEARLRSAIADVTDMQMHLSDLIGRLNTWAARETRKENKDARLALEALGDPEQQEIPLGETPRGRKDELRRRVAGMRGLRRPRSLLVPAATIPSDDETAEPSPSPPTKKKKASSE